MIDAIKSATVPQVSTQRDPEQVKESLQRQAKEFEAVFVGQMLKYSGLADALSKDSGFGGEAFSGLLLEQYAEKIVDRGGFGLADKIYGQLLERQGLNATDKTA